ncbi:dicarboxylic acid hydrolase [Bordetella ansorpii]|uniref:Dicarboxylic acid hydrolase n=1 Tax=Bordetella ansorpii TaxID=288768 RepID=A0A157PNH5_9BORD|nr:amidohydrolase family protein [Bordetella ansorpii]SAI35145.1 dicarboxylic acid hydrolase [Bordetella ansorpii]
MSASQQDGAGGQRLAPPGEHALPGGACDCHVHVVGPQPEYPMVADRHYTPGPAGGDALLRHLAGLGLARAVIVQPSVYGTDNRCMLDSLARMAGAARGIAVVDETIDDAGLRVLHDGWVRGLRLNLESAGRSDPAAIRRSLGAWAERLAPLGWHLQIYASLDAIAAAAPALRGLPVPVVLDHFAMVPARLPHDDPRVQAVFQLVREGTAYVKLSASYRIEPADGAAEATRALARAYAGCNPDRVLWASDWPHTNREPGKDAREVSAYRAIARERLLREIAAWFPDADLRMRALAGNPARLYGF